MHLSRFCREYLDGHTAEGILAHEAVSEAELEVEGGPGGRAKVYSKRLPKRKSTVTSFYGSSCANNGKDALNTPEGYTLTKV